MKALQFIVPILLASVGGAAAVVWLQTPPPAVEMRLPGAEANVVHTAMGAGVFTPGRGTPADIPGAWPCFRGAARDNVSTDPTPLAGDWPPGGPPRLWSVAVGKGYASPAVWKGRAYLLDYDKDANSDALRCLSLANGEEIWRYSYRVPIREDHGYSRTVPAVGDQCVVSLGPKCHVLCLDPLRGTLRWTMDLVKDYGTRAPDWYAGQCPLLDGNRVILAPGGRALVIAVDAASGRVIWETPNPHAWAMSHSSIVPMEFAGRRMYVYCANEGTVGVDADANGAILWETGGSPADATYWKITPTVVPSPVVLPEGRIFLAGGYGAGSLMLQLAEAGGRIEAKALFRLKPEAFGAEQQTPIYYQGHLYGVRAMPEDELVCLDLAGKVVWTSAPKRFARGPLVIAGGMIYVMNDSGAISLVRATPERFQLLAEAKVLEGPDSWGPLVPAAGRLIVRDIGRMTCLDVSRK